MMTKNPRPILLTRQEVSDRYGIPMRTLEHWAEVGRGPAVIRGICRSAMYAEADVIRYLRENGMPVDIAAVQQVGTDHFRTLVDEVRELRAEIAELRSLLLERDAG